MVEWCQWLDGQSGQGRFRAGPRPVRSGPEAPQPFPRFILRVTRHSTSQFVRGSKNITIVLSFAFVIASVPKLLADSIQGGYFF